MAEEDKTKLSLEIGHVLFIDIVGYSKLSISEQSAALDDLNEAARTSEEFQKAEAASRLLKIPTGDGIALVFYTSPEAPAQCAVEISRMLREHPHLQLRMGIHSGPVSGVVDVNERANLAGAGINIAQRVMGCGDAGHILLSKHVAEDLQEYKGWRPLLHDLGSCQVKHGLCLSVVNLHGDGVGNPQLPKKFQDLKKHSARLRWTVMTATLVTLAGIAAFILVFWKPPQPTSLVAEKSIAVLPFQNLSEEKANAFFADGVQDEILTDLAKIADLKVISRTSVMQYRTGATRNLRTIGEELGVAHLVEGSVQRTANRVRVNAQLIDARTDAHLWAHTYDRDLADVFVIQSEIAKAIADQLQAKLSPTEKAAIETPPTTDLAAFDLYSQAKNLILSTNFSAAGGPKILQAVDLLNQAFARDPSFLLAQCQLAYAHDQLYFLGIDHTTVRLTLAQTAVDTAFRLQPDAGEAHLARAEHLYWGYLDYESALVELQNAHRTLPNDPRIFELTGYIARRRGKHEEGLRNLERSLELDPRNFFTLQQIALSYLNLRRYSDEAAVLDRALSIKPDDVETIVTRALNISLDQHADPQPLHQTLDEVRAKDPDAIKGAADIWFLCALAERDPVRASTALLSLGNNPFGNDAVRFYRSFGEGLIGRMMKDEPKARAAFISARAEQEQQIQEQPDYGPALCVLGLIDAGLGRKEEALREGRRAIELLPVEKDSINGAHMIEYFAIIAAWVGEKDVACEQLAKAQQLPGYGTITYGQLKLLPWWDPLRGDPRFEKIVESLAPKK